MSRIRADQLVNRAGSGGPKFPHGVADGFSVSGIVTATSFAGNLTGNVTGNVTGNADTATTATNAQGLTGTPNITVQNATVQGNLTVNGTTTTIDTAVTAVDSLAVDGQVNVGAGLSANGFKVEEGLASGSTLNGVFNFDFDAGHVQKYHGATGGNYEPNFRVSASKTLDSVMGVGDVTSAVLMVISSTHYLDSPNIQIDGSTSNITTHHIGGAAPSAANGSGYDIYSFTIQKTAATPAYYVIVNASSAA